MVIITHSKLNLNVKVKNNDIVIAVQNDSNTRYLDIILLDGTTPINLSGKTVRLYARKPDGTEVYNNAVIRNATEGRVEVLMTNQLLSKIGMVTAQIVISQGATTILTSLPFQIHVVENLFNTSTVESSNEYGSLVVVYQDLMQSKQQMQSILETMGDPDVLDSQVGITTIFEGFNYIIEYLHNNSVAGVANKVDLIKQKTDLIANGAYGLNALRNRIDYNLQYTMGDMLGRKVLVSKNNFKKLKEQTLSTRSIFSISGFIMVTCIEIYAKSKTLDGRGYNYLVVNCDLISDGQTLKLKSIQQPNQINDWFLSNKYFPMGLNGVNITINDPILSNSNAEVEFETTVYYYRM